MGAWGSTQARWLGLRQRSGSVPAGIAPAPLAPLNGFLARARLAPRPLTLSRTGGNTGSPTRSAKSWPWILASIKAQILPVTIGIQSGFKARCQCLDQQAGQV